MSYAQNTNHASITTDQIDQVEAPVVSKKITTSSDFKLALKDVITGFASYRFWTFMGVSEIRRRYRRTIIGPFWTTLSLGLFIGCMGYLLSSLWNSNPKDFLPYFCSGYISWILVQTTIMESCTAFTCSESYIKQVALPYTNYACLIAWRNIIVFMHHLVILTIVLWYSGTSINLNTLLILPALGIFFVTGTWVAIFLGMICSRFRDIQQIVTSFLQLAMFVTPILWAPEQLGARGVLVSTINPLYHFITIIRLPLIGQIPSMINWAVSIGVAVVGSLLTLWMFSKNYRKLVFWL